MGTYHDSSEVTNSDVDRRVMTVTLSFQPTL